MKLIHHFAVQNFSNTYLLGPDQGSEALLIDPGVMDIHLLNLIEKNKYYIKHILLTHNHRTHVDGIRTLQKIYDFNIYSFIPSSYTKDNSVIISDGSILNLGEFTVKVIGIGGHTRDSMAFLIGGNLFTGDVLSAGRVGTTQSNQDRALMLAAINKKLMQLPGETLVFPGHGPPSTLRAEKDFNPNFNGTLIR